jgi:arylsulfatase A-like enzyme
MILAPKNAMTLFHRTICRAFCLVLWSVLIFAPLMLRAAEQRPNLVFILADDLGYAELGCYGQKVIHTPRLDRMAGEGIRFTHFYAGATVCAPSRSVLMTGMHHGRTRVRGNGGGQRQALRETDVTVAKVLRSAGYRTSLIGKWGLGDEGEASSGLPRRQGFDEFYGYLNQHHAHNHFPDFLWRNETREPTENVVTPVGSTGAGYATKAVQFADDLFAEEAVKFVSANKDRPFFLYWSMVSPHANNERTNALKDGAEVPDYGSYAAEPWPAPDKGHAAMVTRMDSLVGRFLDQLDALGLSENTLVVFTSDNGPHNESNHDLNRFQPAGPFSGTKRSLTDGGIRVPFIVRWKGRLKAGTTSDHVGSFTDWFATAAELAWAKAEVPSDSLSFAPELFTKQQPKHDFLYWEFHEREFTQAALYQGRWKGIRSGAPDAPVKVFDQQQDPAEKNDVAVQYPEIANTISWYLDTARSDSPDWPALWKKRGK